MTPFDDGYGPYTYAWKDGSTGATLNTTTALVTWVDVTNTHGCTGRDEGSIVEDNNLKFSIAANENICDGESTTLVPSLKAANGYNFTWTGDQTASSETITVTQSGSFNLYIDNGGGCFGDEDITITVHPLPIVRDTTAAICDGDAALIGGLNNLGSSYSYEWGPDGQTTATISVLTPNTYTQTVTSSQGCVSVAQTVVNVFDNPQPDIEGDVKCLGEQVILEDKNDKGETATWSWSGGTGSGPADSSVYLPLSTATYRLDVVDINGCIGFDETVVTFLDIPEVTTPDSIVMCEGESDLLKADVVDPSNTLSWNTGQGDVASFTVSQNQIHIVTASNGYCQTNDTTEVIVLPIPVSEIDHTIDDITYCFEDDNFRGVEITAGTNSAYSYEWNTGETTPTITAMNPGPYNVTITAGQCPIEDGITLRPYCPSYLYVPNAFTPDGDGLNDEFAPQAYNLEGDYNFYIYNRWGELIFQSTDLNTKWDGTYMGRECQIDVYVWKVYYSVEHPDGNPRKEQKTGRVSLIR